jgi:hypothetical protein
MPEAAIDHTPAPRDPVARLRRQILAVLPVTGLWSMAVELGHNPRAGRRKSGLVSWLLPRWEDAESHVFAYLDRARYNDIEAFYKSEERNMR